MFVLLSAATGTRRSEILALRWRDVCADFGQVRIAHANRDGIPDGLVEKDTKTHQARRVTLDHTTGAALAVHGAAAADRATACGRTLALEALLFSSDGLGEQPWLPDSASRRFRLLCRHAQLDGVRLHALVGRCPAAWFLDGHSSVIRPPDCSAPAW